MYPELADKWIYDEEEMGPRTKNGFVSYFPDVTYRQLRDAAVNQKQLFENIPLDELTPAYNCSCHNF
jgi:hypothetical protein